ncbi:MAG: hypothetical protein M1358_12295 [Chloroflexi bacterium]|nr:hypothetical protein [Chloroflexota bacterium]
MNLGIRDAAFIIVLALIEVAVTETIIRLQLVDIERATSILFILILLNSALVIGLRRPRGR